MTYLSIGEMISLLKKRWWVIFLVTAILTTTTFYINEVLLTTVYSNSSSLIVNEQNQQRSPLKVDDILLYEKLMGTYKDIMMSKRILQPAAQQLGKGLSYDDLFEMVRISTKSNSQVIKITAVHSDYQIATDIANTVAETFKQNLHDIMAVNNVQILDKAELKETPDIIAPRKTLNTGLAFMLGLLLSSSLIIILRFMDHRVRTEEDLLISSDLPLIGTIPSISSKEARAYY
jgi:capsular polysaccharide biosynthesis protein